MNWAYREKRWRESGGVLVISQKEAENENTEGQKGMMEIEISSNLYSFTHWKKTKST